MTTMWFIHHCGYGCGQPPRWTAGPRGPHLEAGNAATVVLALLAGGGLLVLAVAYGPLRALVGVAMGLGILIFGVRWIRSAVTSQPDPELTDVSDYGLKYVCTMCGLELRVEVAARDKAPTHCMEPMVLVRTGGRPPLRPLP